MTKKRNRFKEMILWYYPTKKTFTGIFVVLIAFAFAGFLIFSDSFDNSDKTVEKYRGETSGVIISIDSREQISQSMTGNRVTNLGYLIEYSYVVKGINYSSTHFFKNNAKNRTKVGRIKAGQFVVRYSPYDPEKSIIYVPN